VNTGAFTKSVVEQAALARLNPALQPEALDDALRKLTRPEGPTLEARNRALHRLLVDGVTVDLAQDPDCRVLFVLSKNTHRNE
jgi:type I site-specific restriction-modification system R (restriction) subunit